MVAVTVITITARLIIKRYGHCDKFGKALLRPSPYFISFTDIDANIVTRYFYPHDYRYFSATIVKVWV